MSLPTDPTERKRTPITTGVLDYFPDAIAEVARVSWQGNEQHNAGEPLHWAREKSQDHSDCIARHLLERGKRDTDGMRHSAKLAWRALALLQLELEAERDAAKRDAANEPIDHCVICDEDIHPKVPRVRVSRTKPMGGWVLGIAHARCRLAMTNSPWRVSDEKGEGDCPAVGCIMRRDHEGPHVCLTFS